MMQSTVGKLNPGGSHFPFLPDAGRGLHVVKKLCSVFILRQLTHWKAMRQECILISLSSSWKEVTIEVLLSSSSAMKFIEHVINYSKMESSRNKELFNSFEFWNSFLHFEKVYMNNFVFHCFNIRRHFFSKASHWLSLNSSLHCPSTILILF